MKEALVVCSAEKSTALFSAILLRAGFEKSTYVLTAGAARRALITQEFDLILIQAPLKDELGDGFAASLASNGQNGVILVIDHNRFDEIASRVEEYGVVCVSRPIEEDFLWNAIKLVSVVSERLREKVNENKRLLRKIEDIKLIDRAKCLLISYLNLSEPEAHKYIEKQAMDLRRTKRQVAEGIIKTYEN